MLTKTKDQHFIYLFIYTKCSPATKKNLIGQNQVHFTLLVQSKLINVNNIVNWLNPKRKLPEQFLMS